MNRMYCTGGGTKNYPPICIYTGRPPDLRRIRTQDPSGQLCAWEEVPFVAHGRMNETGVTAIDRTRTSL